MMSCLCHPHVMQTMMTWCSYNVNTNDVMPPHFYVAQMECEHWQHHGDVVCIICEPCDVTMGMCIARRGMAHVLQLKWVHLSIQMA